MIKFIPLGGADEIGASCFYIEIAGTGLLLDCGIHPRLKGLEALPNFDTLSDLSVDFVFISHAHQDHLGGLPFLIKRFPHIKIFATEQTKEIAAITLHNAVNILKNDYETDNPFPIYSHEEIDFLVRSMVEVKYNETIELSGLRHTSSYKLKISFHDAGHILGAAGILIEFNEQTIFYTGDINISHQSIMNGAELKEIKNINTLILESTYGSTDSLKLGTWESESIRFAKSINKVLNEGGSVLIPVFALGKTQEILSLIHDMMLKGKLIETDIYTGGISREISNLYDKNRYVTRRRDKNFAINDVPQINLLEIEDYNIFRKRPGIVLASSGMMLPGTTSYKLLDFWMRHNNFAIFIVGYMDAGAPGYVVANSNKGDKIKLTEFSETREIKCNVERFYFPSHSRREDLVKMVKKTNPGKVILIHGESNSKNWLGSKILEDLSHIKVYSASTGRTILI